jgi:type I restriction enzyme, S subunit
MKPYPKYKKTIIEWIGDIPEDWEIRRLKYVMNIRNSNVDKKTNTNEEPVRLCNYVDTYKNEKINNKIDFMNATATESEIETFKIDKGDVIITKDSETPDDIAVPAYIEEDLNNVLCGYHQTLIKPKKLIGGYVFRYFQSIGIRQFFETEAKGVTRYGLSLSSIENLLIPTPNYDEQTSIATYLDNKTALIDDLISKNEKMIELLEEKRKAYIENLIGYSEFGLPLKYIINTQKGFAFKSDSYKTSGIKIVKASEIKNNTLTGSTTFLDPQEVSKYAQYQLKKDDIVLATVGSHINVSNSAVGQIAIVPEERRGDLLNQNTVILRTVDSRFLQKYIFFVMTTSRYRQHLDLFAHGTANQASLSLSDILSYKIEEISVEKQIDIISSITKHNELVNDIVEKLSKQNDLLVEYRKSLISNVVTGKVQVC